MTASVLASLRSLYPSLTAAEQRLAETILARPDTVTGLSGRELARLGETSEPVLFRLVRKLQFDGFQAFKSGLSRDASAEQARAELGIFNVPFHTGSPLPVRVQEVMQAYAINLEQTARLLVDQPLDEVAGAIADASLVTLVGMGASLSVATLAENVLVRVGIPCRLSLDSHLQLLQALYRAEGQVVVAFSFSGETREVVEAMAIAREARARTIAHTAFDHSPVAQEADLVVRVPVVNPMRYRVGLVDAVLPFLMIIDLLAIRIGAGRDVRALRDRVEEVIERRKLRSQRPARPRRSSTAAPTWRTTRLPGSDDRA
jgi:DNA-binding MurR/RpiR family transcriptional regulator